jgi:hypothetical protein
MRIPPIASIATVSLSTGDGSIDADGVQGEIRLHTGDGSIGATGLSGRLKADTGDGSMTVRGRFDVLDLRTGDGSINATAETGSKVEAAWSFHSGDSSVTGPSSGPGSPAGRPDGRRQHLPGQPRHGQGRDPRALRPRHPGPPRPSAGAATQPVRWRGRVSPEARALCWGVGGGRQGVDFRGRRHNGRW